jgi:hypothetical protein
VLARRTPRALGERALLVQDRSAGQDAGVLTSSQARSALGDLIAAAAASAGESRAGLSRLAVLAPEDLVRLDDDARTGWPWSGPPWSDLPTGRADLVRGGGLAAAVASMHPDGRVRQRAAVVITQVPGPLPAALLAVRSVDHVAQVREAAALGLRARASVADARHALPVLSVVERRTHGAAALSGYADALLTANGGPRVLLELLDVPDRLSRRWVFSACLDRGLLSAEDVLAASQDRHDQVIRRAAAEHLAAHRDATGTGALRELLAGRYAEGRTAALIALSDDELDDGDIRAALLDRSPRVRDTARWRARRRGMDVVEVYRRALGEANDTRTAVPCLTGLLWVGDRSDLPAVARHLEHDSPSVRVAATRALVALSPPGGAADRIGPLLLDVSPRVAGVAARALSQAAAPGIRAAEEAAWTSAQPWSRRAAWRLGHLRGGWDRVEADLRAAADPELSDLGRAGLREWLRHSAATTWNRPDGARTARIGVLLDGAGLDEESTRLVAFHVGLPRLPTPVVTTPLVDPASDGGEVRRGGWWRRRPRA